MENKQSAPLKEKEAYHQKQIFTPEYEHLMKRRKWITLTLYFCNISHVSLCLFIPKNELVNFALCRKIVC